MEIKDFGRHFRESKWEKERNEDIRRSTKHKLIMIKTKKKIKKNETTQTREKNNGKKQQ